MAEIKSCLICDRISMIINHTNPYYLAELNTGYVVLGDFQFYKGYALFLCKKHVSELHELEQNTKTLFLEEMSVVAEAIFKCFKPNKLNYELLGNSDRHLHWHIFPRYKHDPFPKEPIWHIPKTIRCAKKYRPSSIELDGLKKNLRTELKKILNKKTKIIKRDIR